MTPVTTQIAPKLLSLVRKEAKVDRLKMYVVFEQALKLWLAERAKREAA